jgi:hypothetical protein
MASAVLIPCATCRYVRPADRTCAHSAFTSYEVDVYSGKQTAVYASIDDVARAPGAACGPAALLWQLTLPQSSLPTGAAVTPPLPLLTIPPVRL